MGNNKVYCVIEDNGVNTEKTISLIAGRNPDNELIVEEVAVTPLEQANSYQLIKSPMFVRGIAKADKIQALDRPQGAFNVLQHSGNLCIRVFGKGDLATMEQTLSSEVEKLGGSLDICQSQALVYSIHVSCGFNSIENIFNANVHPASHAQWFYGNVYDPDNGEPLNWWLPILSPE